MKFVLKEFVRLVIEAEIDKNEPMGLKLPDVRDSSQAKGDELPEERAKMRLQTSAQKTKTAIEKIKGQSELSDRNGIRKGADPALDLKVAVDSGAERQYRSDTKHAVKNLERSLSSGHVNPNDVNAALNKVIDNPAQNTGTKARTNAAKVPLKRDLARDIKTASKEDEDGEQFFDLTSLVNSIVASQRDAIDTANVAANISDEKELQRKRKVRA